MHVLILPSWYPRFPGDIEGSFFRDQAMALADAGLNVGVVFPDLQGPRRYFKGAQQTGIKITRDGPINEVRSFGFNWFSGLMRGFEWLWLRHGERAIAAYFEKFGKPDVIHVHSMLPAASLAERLRMRHGIPFVVTEHSSYLFHIKVPDNIKTKCARLAQSSSANLAVSQIVAEELNRRYSGNWSYLPNIVSPKFLSHPLITPSTDKTRLISVALLRLNKRMDLVIDAVDVLRKRGFNVTLTIIGDGDHRTTLEKRVSQLGLTEFVHFAGLIPVSNMPTTMATGHILVSASEFETFGVTLIEGLALGMPVVATRSGGPESIVTRNVGRLVDKWEATAFADAVEEVMVGIDQFRPEKMRSHCEAHYSAGVVAAALQLIYMRVVDDVQK
jgi:L-malate glycosyltransferase